MNSKFSVLFSIVLILSLIFLSSCAPKILTVYTLEASEHVGTGLDGNPVIIEEFTVVLEECIVTGENNDQLSCFLRPPQMITREQFNKNSVGSRWVP